MNVLKPHKKLAVLSALLEGCSIRATSNVFSEVLSKALADHLGFAMFLGTIHKGRNQLYRTYEAGKEDPGWFTLWQNIDHSLKIEDDAATLMLEQAMRSRSRPWSKRSRSSGGTRSARWS